MKTKTDHYCIQQPKIDEIAKDNKVMAADVKEIKEALLGNPEYKTEGIIKEHREMYEFYISSKALFRILGVSNLGTAGALLLVLIKVFRLY